MELLSRSVLESQNLASSNVGALTIRIGFWGFLILIIV